MGNQWGESRKALWDARVILGPGRQDQCEVCSHTYVNHTSASVWSSCACKMLGCECHGKFKRKPRNTWRRLIGR